MFIPYDKNVHTFDKKHFPSLAFDDMMQEDEVQNIINMKRAVKYAMKKHPYKVYCTEKVAGLPPWMIPRIQTAKRKSENPARKNCGLRWQTGMKRIPKTLHWKNSIPNG